MQTDQAAKQSVSVRPLSPRARFTRRNCHKNRGSSGESNATGIPSCPPHLCLILSASFSTRGRESGCSQPSEPLSISGTQRVSLVQLQFVKNLLVTCWTNDCGQTGWVPQRARGWRQVPQLWPAGGSLGGGQLPGPSCLDTGYLLGSPEHPLVPPK